MKDKKHSAPPSDFLIIFPHKSLWTKPRGSFALVLLGKISWFCAVYPVGMFHKSVLMHQNRNHPRVSHMLIFGDHLHSDVQLSSFESDFSAKLTCSRLGL